MAVRTPKSPNWEATYII